MRAFHCSIGAASPLAGVLTILLFFQAQAAPPAAKPPLPDEQRREIPDFGKGFAKMYASAATVPRSP